MSLTTSRFAKKLACMAFLVLGACSAQTSPPATSPGAPPPPPPEVTREIQLKLGSYLQHCPNTLIRFPYNESQALPQDTPELQALAACLNSSPYQGIKLRLVGRTDREGSDTYNQTLGLKRAQYVKDALVRAGVDPLRIEMESAGAEQAGEGAPGYDRRVDVVQLVAVNPI